MKYFLLFLIVATFAEILFAKNDGKKASKFVNDKLTRGPNGKRQKLGRDLVDPVQTDWILQQLDNFDSSNTNTWWMRYMYNLKNFKPQSPIFIYVGAEWSISPGDINSGLFYDIGKELNAAFYYTEHRYYGESQPTPDLTTENLKYINTSQALADLANFITTIKQQPNMTNSKVILASGSYGGAMVTWFKKLYPDLITGGWASSAPLFAIVNFVGYCQTAGKSLEAVCGKHVYNQVARGIRHLESLYDEDYDTFQTKMKVCPNFDKNNKYDMWNLFKTLSNLFSNIIQSKTEQGIIDDICNVFQNYEGSDLDAIIYFFTSIMDPETCIALSYEDLLSIYTPTNWSYYGGFSDRAWQYQLCTEFGYFQTSSTAEPFGTRFPVEFFLKQCLDLFGIESNEVYDHAQETNNLFGGFHPNVTNIFWTQGSLDPWNSLGIHENNGKNNVMKWYTHYYDTSSISTEYDTEQMIKQKEQIRISIRSWLGYN